MSSSAGSIWCPAAGSRTSPPREGRSNAAVGARLHLSESAVSKNIASIFDKLGLVPSEDDNRRVLAVLAYLQAATAAG